MEPLQERASWRRRPETERGSRVGRKQRRVCEVCVTEGVCVCVCVPVCVCMCAWVRVTSVSDRTEK